MKGPDERAGRAPSKTEKYFSQDNQYAPRLGSRREPDPEPLEELKGAQSGGAIKGCCGLNLVPSKYTR